MESKWFPAVQKYHYIYVRNVTSQTTIGDQ